MIKTCNRVSQLNVTCGSWHVMLGVCPFALSGLLLSAFPLSESDALHTLTHATLFSSTLKIPLIQRGTIFVSAHGCERLIEV